jgi:hypothetical protein
MPGALSTCRPPVLPEPDEPEDCSEGIAAVLKPAKLPDADGEQFMALPT